MASGAGVWVAETRVSCGVIDGAAQHWCNRRCGIGVTCSAFLHIMESGEQAAFCVALCSGAVWVFGNVSCVQNVMDSWF